ncbi:MAG: prepilin peptidase [Acidobacteriaceae bacterium]|nr:prepilin peptidase [Acidobacteriaceae bacterium]
MPSPHQFVLLGFLPGLLFGSFLNVCISRLPAHQSIAKPRSHCNSCGRLIRWYDNIPVLSWLVLRARCRDCAAPIPWRYPLVEIAVGLWFALCANKVLSALDGVSPPVLGRSIFASEAVAALGLAILGFLLLGLMVMDWQTQRLPDAFTLTGIVLGFGVTCIQAFLLAPVESPAELIVPRIAAIAVAAFLLLAIRWLYRILRRQDGMGLGDVKMLAMIAAFLGLDQTLLTLLAGVLAASLYGLALLALRRANAASKLPFGSFLAAGGLCSALFGQPIVAWYLSLMR